ncbi:hypothetical protein DL95DRAFT_379237 [Leptodontidium sp. 2 PMI_412]|nr:hypothetical protein DL95DRAFT_379237 [Leptodontidium sp. 2 PMI_412]
MCSLSVWSCLGSLPGWKGQASASPLRFGTRVRKYEIDSGPLGEITCQITGCSHCLQPLQHCFCLWSQGISKTPELFLSVHVVRPKREFVVPVIGWLLVVQGNGQESHHRNEY